MSLTVIWAQSYKLTISTLTKDTMYNWQHYCVCVWNMWGVHEQSVTVFRSTYVHVSCRFHSLCVRVYDVLYPSHLPYQTKMKWWSALWLVLADGVYVCAFSAQWGVRKLRPWTWFAPTIQQPYFLLEAMYGQSCRKWNPNFDTKFAVSFGKSEWIGVDLIYGFQMCIDFFFWQNFPAFFFLFFFLPEHLVGGVLVLFAAAKSWHLCFTFIAFKPHTHTLWRITISHCI